MHDKVALWEEKQNGFEILMRYNMIQGPLRNRREGLNAAESTQTSNEKPYALILYLTKHPRNHQTLYPAAGADMETHSYMKNKPNLATTFSIAMTFYEIH